MRSLFLLLTYSLILGLMLGVFYYTLETQISNILFIFNQLVMIIAKNTI